MSQIAGHSVALSGRGRSSAQQYAPWRLAGTIHALTTTGGSKVWRARRFFQVLLMMILPLALPAQSDLSSISGTVTYLIGTPSFPEAEVTLTLWQGTPNRRS